MFEQAFKNIDDVLRKEAGCTTELDYTEQTSWLLFLKYLDALEQDKADEAALEGKKYGFILDTRYRWEQWAAPKGNDGHVDHNRAMTGDDLADFVNEKLFPYLQGFRDRATGPNTIEYKIGEIFAEIKNKISSGYSLREIIDCIDELRFRSQSEKHELSHLYEAKIKNMGNAGRNGGEYYTPRPLIRAMVRVVRPKIGETVYDGACGSAGFLCESFDFMKAKPGLTTKDLKTLQQRTFIGKEKKSLAYVLAIMNMILHGIEAPNIIHTNTLTENLADIQEKDRFDVVLANPPFGGKERKEVQQNFPIRTGETAFLFLQHFIKMLNAGGRGGVVIKNTFLSNGDNASVSLRQLLLESCNLHTVLDCPGGTFLGAGAVLLQKFAGRVTIFGREATQYRHDSLARGSITEGVRSRRHGTVVRPIGQRALQRLYGPIRIRTDELSGAAFDRLGSLGRFTHHQYGLVEPWGLLLNSTRVRHHDRATVEQPNKLKLVQRGGAK